MNSTVTVAIQNHHLISEVRSLKNSDYLVDSARILNRRIEAEKPDLQEGISFLYYNIARILETKSSTKLVQLVVNESRA